MISKIIYQDCSDYAATERLFMYLVNPKKGQEPGERYSGIRVRNLMTPPEIDDAMQNKVYSKYLAMEFEQAAKSSNKYQKYAQHLNLLDSLDPDSDEYKKQSLLTQEDFLPSRLYYHDTESFAHGDENLDDDEEENIEEDIIIQDGMSVEEAFKINDEFLDGAYFKKGNYRVVSVMHPPGKKHKHRHIHNVVSPVCIDTGVLYDASNNFEIRMEVNRKIELKYGLRVVESVDLKPDDFVIIPANKKEKREEEAGITPDRIKLAMKLKQIESVEYEDFDGWLEALSDNNIIPVVFLTDDEKEIKGIRFEDIDSCQGWAGGKIAKNNYMVWHSEKTDKKTKGVSIKGVKTRHGYDHKRHFNYLVQLTKNYHAPKFVEPEKPEELSSKFVPIKEYPKYSLLRKNFIVDKQEGSDVEKYSFKRTNNDAFDHNTEDRKIKFFNGSDFCIKASLELVNEKRMSDDAISIKINADEYFMMRYWIQNQLMGEENKNHMVIINNYIPDDTALKRLSIKREEARLKKIHNKMKYN